MSLRSPSACFSTAVRGFIATSMAEASFVRRGPARLVNGDPRLKLAPVSNTGTEQQRKALPACASRGLEIRAEYRVRTGDLRLGKATFSVESHECASPHP